MSYAVISIGNKQYRVREGQRLLVDRVPHDEGKTFHPDLVMLGGDGDPKLGSDLKGEQVTVKVAEHVRGQEDHHRQAQAPHGLQAPERLPRQPHADRGAVDRRDPDTLAATKEETTKAEAKPAAAKKPAARKPAATAEKKAPARRSAPKKQRE